jgi:hypothetical protein
LDNRAILIGFVHVLFNKFSLTRFCIVLVIGTSSARHLLLPTVSEASRGGGPAIRLCQDLIFYEYIPNFCITVPPRYSSRNTSFHFVLRTIIAGIILITLFKKHYPHPPPPQSTPPPQSPPPSDPPPSPPLLDPPPCPPL